MSVIFSASPSVSPMQAQGHALDCGEAVCECVALCWHGRARPPPGGRGGPLLRCPRGGAGTGARGSARRNEEPPVMALGSEAVAFLALQILGRVDRRFSGPVGHDPLQRVPVVVPDRITDVARARLHAVLAHGYSSPLWWPIRSCPAPMVTST